MLRTLLVLTLLGGFIGVAEAQTLRTSVKNRPRMYRSRNVVRPQVPLNFYVEAEPHHAGATCGGCCQHRTSTLAEALVLLGHMQSQLRSMQPQTVVQQQVPLNVYGEAEPHHASTVNESWLRGWAALWRSYGTYLYLRGQGAIGWEKAREHYLRNRELAIDAWYARKLFNHQFRFPQRPKASFSQLVAAQRKALPERIGTNELSPFGQIYWPDLLMAAEFDEHRQALDKLFRTRASNVRAGKSALRKAITDESDALHAELRSRIREYIPSDYTAARKFIEKLRYEARFDNPVALVRR